MMKQLPQILFILMIVVCSVLMGIWFGQNTLTKEEGSDKSDKYMHSMLHEQLKVTDIQDKQLANIEKKFNRLIMLYQGQIKTANMELANTIKVESYDSPKIKTIIHKIHTAMGKLQALSLEHLTQMQNVLNKKQKTILKELVIKQLYKNANE